MIDWKSCTKWGTWGGFIEHAKKHGVAVHELPPGDFADRKTPAAMFLMRTTRGGEVLTYPVPLNCTPDRQMGPLRFMQICDRLRIPEPKDWPIVL